ncbi:hypothetical protein CABS01_03308 [Colletotrichum abscissum]|uniref:Uncharacterized protein n=1 Tax=Colletotrichum abscissum TaxID=1671311 RepID=A0A9P9X9F7_9PEZI|nr:uncharacterized protein CABS01_03308 [Colletotrichum abscissum]KAI3543054.1 hypothetical protein CABS02_10178 [Colletotrichum abscissum]KAK1478006.1 hypothetical protein CABS01_03308 [Colletotrichum abscissum]
MFPDPSDSISKKKNHPIDAIVVCQAVATEHRRNDLGARCGLRLLPGNMMNHRTPLNVPALFPDSVFGSGAVRHRRRRPLLRTHAHYTPQPLGRSIDGLGMTARYESRASRLQTPDSSQASAPSWTLSSQSPL